VSGIGDRSKSAIPQLPSAVAITHAIAGALLRDAAIDVESISVHCDGNEVWLSGRVQSWAAYLHAEVAARAMAGVREVHNDIRLRTPRLMRRGDDPADMAA
jgi:osmotically-inducible protein OsmY